MAETLVHKDQLIKTLRAWQKIENSTVASTAQAIMETQNPILRLAMEIIQRDSNLHHRILHLMIGELESKSYPLPAEDVLELWDLIVRHQEMETHTIEAARQALERLEAAGGAEHITVRFLLDFLLRDEEKHEAMIANLQKIAQDYRP